MAWQLNLKLDSSTWSATTKIDWRFRIELNEICVFRRNAYNTNENAHNLKKKIIKEISLQSKSSGANQQNTCTMNRNFIGSGWYNYHW